MLENPDFANALGLRVPDRVPPEEYDNLLEKPTRTPEEDLRMGAYKLYVPDEFIEDYVNYYSMETTGFDQERYLKDNPEYYQEVWRGLLGNQAIDFSRIPSEQFETAYLAYSVLPTTGTERRDFRQNNPWFDEEGALLGKWKSLASQKQTVVSKTDQFTQKWEEFAAATFFTEWLKQYMRRDLTY